MRNLDEKSSALWQLLKCELADYPGRLSLVARLTLSCTAAMVAIMVFRIPNAPLGAYFPLLIPRDGARSTARAAGITALVCIAGTLELLTGAALFGASPMLHFFWTIANIFAVFYLMSTMLVQSAVVGFGLLVLNGVSVWDASLSANTRVSLTLYSLLSVVIGCAMTCAVEYLFERTHAPDRVVDGIRERLRVARELFETYLQDRQPEPILRHHLGQSSRRGTGYLRELLAHSTYDESYRDELRTALALSHELMELTSNLAELTQHLCDEDRRRLRAVVQMLLQAETHLRKGEAPDRVELPAFFAASATMPSLGEIERNVELILDVFTEGSSEMMLQPPGAARGSIFAEDIFRGNRHLRFATRGTLSAVLCYLAYSSVGWKGLGASVVTCFLTALTSVGMARQKQLLRISGVFLGGCVLGFGSMLLLLPQIDTVPEFAVVFAGCTFLCAWVATSSARVAFAGLQMALAYDLINLNGFAINTSLVVAGSSLFGILVGLASMWLIYDHLWATSSVESFRAKFFGNLRRIGGLGTHPETRSGHEMNQAREAIGAGFDELRSFSDSLVFEPHPPSKEALDMVLRLSSWLPELRAISLIQFGLITQATQTSPMSLLAKQTLMMTSQTMDWIHQQVRRKLEPSSLPRQKRVDFDALLANIEQAQQLAKSLDRAFQTEMRLAHSLATLVRDLHNRVDEGRPTSDLRGSLALSNR